MCKMTKLASIIRGENAWRIPMSSGVLGFVLGMSCFGIAIKLTEYKNSPSLPPMLAGIPMLGAGIAGMVGGRMRKKWLISVHTVLCLIASVLSLHLMFLFLGREADSRERHKAKCQSNFKGEFFCHRYAATIAMSALSVVAVTLAPLGILSHVVIRRMSGYNVNEVQEANNPTFERRRDPESPPRPKRTDGRHPPQQAKKACDRPPTNHARSKKTDSRHPPQQAKKACNRPSTNHSRPERTDDRHPSQQAKRAGDRPKANHANNAQPQRNHRQLNYNNYHGNLRVPPSHRQASNNKHPDHNRHNRQLYQQRNLPFIIAAQNNSIQQSHIPPEQRLQRGLSNTTDTSFA